MNIAENCRKYHICVPRNRELNLNAAVFHFRPSNAVLSCSKLRVINTAMKTQPPAKFLFNFTRHFRVHHVLTKLSCFSGWNGARNAVSALLHTSKARSVLVLFVGCCNQLFGSADNDMHITCSGKTLQNRQS